MEVLARGAEEFGILLSPEQLALFERCYQELAYWNRRVNLTSVTGLEEVQRKHFLDSLTVLTALPPAPREGALTLLDVGSGAGFPGVPLKIARPALQVALLEARRKKVEFLEHLVATLGLREVQVLHGRAEVLAHQSEQREAYDAVVARGLAPLPSLLELCLPFCRVGGLCIAQKKGELTKEVEDGRRAAGLFGGELAELRTLEIAALGERRYLVIFAKTEPTPPSYPRRPGIPRKRPLCRSQS